MNFNYLKNNGLKKNFQIVISIVFFLFLFYFTVNAINNALVTKNAQNIQAKLSTSYKSIDHIQVLFSQTQVLFREAINYGSISSSEKGGVKLEEVINELTKLTKLENNTSQTSLNELKASIYEYKKLSERVIVATLTGKGSDTIITDTNNKISLENKIIEKIALEKTESEKKLFSSLEFANKLFSKMIYFSLMFLVLILAISIIFYKLTVKIIIEPIIRSSENLAKKGVELNQLSSKLNMVGNDLSHSSNRQLTATKESILLMEELKDAIDKTNELIENSQKQITFVNNQVAKGNSTINDFDVTVTDLQASQKYLKEILTIIGTIYDKTQVINEIVSNSKILSFNASIEAARAGIHGRGFSIVANEISKMADISGNAALNIEELIDNSKKQITKIINNFQSSIFKSSEISKETSKVFHDISNNIKDINGKIIDVSNSYKEQVCSVVKTRTGLQQMSELAIKNNQISNSANMYSKKLYELNSALSGVMNLLNTISKGKRK
ncbi:MAG: hypothetical protein HQK51_11745 [Oligoflexia bacterium]|nr:hypothetical protein [Oligoflexia bacterium]